VQRWRRPTVEELRAFARGQATAPFSYPEVGATTKAVLHPTDPAATLPDGYTIDRYGIDLGTGEELYERARQALRRWDHTRLGWVEVVPASDPTALGTDLAIHVHVPPTHFLNGGRVTVMTDHDAAGRRAFSIGYGTLLDHAEQGEEAFTVSWDRATNVVRYDVLAFSRPRLPMARMLKPWTRRLQKHFARDTCAAMQQAVGSSGSGT